MNPSRLDPTFWSARRVFLTGHTGFKGGWTSLMLARFGAQVTGFALPPQSELGIFTAARVGSDVRHIEGDIQDMDALTSAMASAKPELVVHMAAQPLVRESYLRPIETYAVNVMGTVHLLEAARRVPGVKAIVVVTSDKCYDNREWAWGYREGEPMGGHDPYSNSKGCAELVTASFRTSFFAAGDCFVASARAGNVIGGGDWSVDRLVPDAMRAFTRGETLQIRRPSAIRPWQHVLEPISAYLLLAQQLLGRDRDRPNGAEVAEPWNFGPGPDGEISVAEVVEDLVARWGDGACWQAEKGPHPHEAEFLKLDCAKARSRLGWMPRIDVRSALAMSVEWYRAQHAGADMRNVSLDQIGDFLQRCAV